MTMRQYYVAAYAVSESIRRDQARDVLLAVPSRSLRRFGKHQAEKLVLRGKSFIGRSLRRFGKHQAVLKENGIK